jgi:DNA polymerase-3 subunit delta
VDHLAVVDNARRYPMMSPYQVVMVKEAQEMRDLKELEKYVANPSPTTLLVLCHKHKSFNANNKFGKLLAEKGVVFESKKLYDNQVPEWIEDYLKRISLRITPGAADILAEYLGTDLSIVAHELDKLALHLASGTEITAQHVEEYVGISREYNIFELQKALAYSDKVKVARILQNFLANPKRNPFVMVNGALVSFFTKVYMMHFMKNASDADAQKELNLRSTYALREYHQAARHFTLHKTEQIIGMLKDYDLMSKGVEYNTVGKEEGELLREMIWRVMN